MRTAILSLLVICTFAAAAGAQKKVKPWTEWSDKEARKILDDSAWGQTQTETSTSEMVFVPGRGTTGRGSRSAPGDVGSTATGATASGGSPTDDSQGAYNQATSIKYHIRFLSAKPVREAVARMVQSSQKSPDAKLTQQLQEFIDRRFDEWIVVSVVAEAKDQRFSGAAMQIFNSANTGLLKNSTFLETKGKRLFLEEYRPPISDGLGAKFVFKRQENGEPTIPPDGGDLRFYSELSKNIRLNMKFKLSDMNYDGKLEY
jgi:hypothetical protein